MGPFYDAVAIGKGKSKNRWFLAAFLHPFAAEGKRMSRRSAKYSRRRQTCRTRVQPAIEERKTGRRDASHDGVHDRNGEETTRARGAEYLFYILPQKHKRLQRKVSFSRRGSLYLDRRRASAPLPAACYQLSCVLYWATIRQTGIWRDRFL